LGAVSQIWGEPGRAAGAKIVACERGKIVVVVVGFGGIDGIVVVGRRSKNRRRRPQRWRQRVEDHQHDRQKVHAWEYRRA